MQEIDDPAMPPLGFSPRVFALCQTFIADDDETENVENEDVENGETSVVAWGMTLPDGSAVAVCPDRPGWGSMTIASSPESVAFIHGADLIWATTA